MAWKILKGICDRCGKESDCLEPAFGKHICAECKTTRPRKGKGNAGLFSSGQGMLSFEQGLHLTRVPKSNGLFGQLFFSHYPGSKGIPGRSLCYLAYDGMELIGIIGVNSPPCNYKIFRKYFFCENDNCFVNNNVYRMIVQRKNLGTQILKLFRKTVKRDYEEKYGEKLLGIVTFVEPPRTGAIYKADNWDYLGLTQGKRMKRDKETWQKVFSDGVEKHIYGYKY
jgi:hypothetical protein